MARYPGKWTAMLLTGMAGGMAWGIRWSYVHETGARKRLDFSRKKGGFTERHHVGTLPLEANQPGTG